MRLADRTPWLIGGVVLVVVLALAMSRWLRPHQTPPPQPEIVINTVPPLPPPPQMAAPVPPDTSCQFLVDDVEATAAKNAATIQRCWMRAQRHADWIADGVRVRVTATIDHGSFTDPTIDHYQGTLLEKCLKAAIVGWKLPARSESCSSKVRFMLVFVAD